MVTRGTLLELIAKQAIFTFSITGFPGFIFSIDSANLKKDIEKNLPLWFKSNRIQGHTRFYLSFLNKDPKMFWNSNRILKEIGIDVLTRHFKSAGEGAWWFTKYGKVNPIVIKLRKNIAQKVILDAHQKGLHVIAYYRHMEDKFISRKYPKWMCFVQ